MLENVGYSFDSIEDVLIFVDWLQETFEDAEGFESFLADKFPAILEVEGSDSAMFIINPCIVMDEEEDDGGEEEDEMFTEAMFWDMIHHEYHHEDLNGPTIHDTN
jgi:hypothetical protein